MILLSENQVKDSISSVKLQLRSCSRIASRLTLIGTIHSDSGGFKKAVKCLESLQPDLIFIEISPFAHGFRVRNQQAYHKSLQRNLKNAADHAGISYSKALKHPEIIAIRRQISLPFEYRAAVAYSRKRATKLVLADYSAFSKMWIASWSELVSLENLTMLLSLLPESTPVADEYLTAARRIRGRGITHEAAFSATIRKHCSMWEKRERYMARKIQLALCRAEPRQPVYIGGWWHLTTGQSIPTVRDILQVDFRRCLLLNDLAH